MHFGLLNRRKFVTLLGGAVGWPRGVLAQATGRRPLVAFIWLYAPEQIGGERNQRLFLELLAGLRELGDLEGREFETLHRGAQSGSSRSPS
jgi:hypothetical protein